LSDFSGPTSRRTSRGSQCLLSDVLQIVIQSHLLSDQAFDGKPLNAPLPHARQQTDGSALPPVRGPHAQPFEDRWSRWTDQGQRNHPVPHNADTFSDPVLPAKHLGQLARGASGQRGQHWKGHTRGNVATSPPLMRPLIVVVGKKCFGHFSHPLSACWDDEPVSTPAHRFCDTARQRHFWLRRCGGQIWGVMPRHNKSRRSGEGKSRPDTLPTQRGSRSKVI